MLARRLRAFASAVADSFILSFHLAHIGRGAHIAAAACHMVFAGRLGGDFIDPALVAELEPKVGRACLDAIIAFPISAEVSCDSGAI